MVRVKKWLLFLGPKISVFGPKIRFLPYDPILVNDPFLALGMTVNYTNELGCQGENPATSQCIFSSQLGQGRTTLGMTVACIVKAVLMSTKLNKMVETGIGSPEWAENIIKKVMVVMMMNNVH